MSSVLKTPQAGPCWPVPVRTAFLPDDIAVCRAVPGQPQPERDPSGQRCIYLDAEGRQRLWAGIQREDPALAELIQSEEFQLTRQLFGQGELLLTPEQLQRFMREPT